MKTFLISKINILLSLLLVGVVATAGFLGYEFLIKNSKTIVPDFLGKDKQEVIEWCGQLSDPHACEFIYEETTNTEKDKVFQQSVSAGYELNGTITFRISSGIIKEIALPVLSSDTTKEDIEKWKTDNEITIVNYVEENSDTVEKGKIIRIEPTEKITKDTVVTVYISKGKKENDENSAGDFNIKYGEYLNLTVSEFENKVKELGLVPNHDTSRDTSSSSVKKGNIVWHGSGAYVRGEKINYGVCTEEVKGIEVKEGEYVGKTEAEFKVEATLLGLTANHDTSRDAYSSTIAKGSVVTHGFGTYVKDEKFNYGLSLGPKSGSQTSTSITVSKGAYVGKSESEFKSIAEGLGLNPVHNSEWDEETTDSSKAGKVCYHGYSSNYTKGENLRYGLYKSKAGSETPTTPSTGETIKIISTQFIDKSEAELKSAAEGYGLVPVHNPDWDVETGYASKVGLVCRNGYGTYVKGENFRYGLYKQSGSTGEETNPSTTEYIKITSTQFLNITEAEFKTESEKLGLVPVHNPDWDQETNDSSKNGKICRHGYANNYVKGENLRYGLYKYVETPAVEMVTIESKSGSTEADFQAYILDKGMVLGTKSTAYSSTVEEGRIISNDTGTLAKGSSINYVVSLGVEPESTASIMRPENYAALVKETYEATKTSLESALGSFTNITFEGVSSTKRVGQLEKITVNGDESYTAGSYPLSTPIVVYIVSEQTN